MTERKKHGVLPWSLVMTVCVLTANMAQAQTDSTSHKNSIDKLIDWADWVLDHVTMERRNFSLAIYPAASYSDRTGLSVGLMPMMQIEGNKLAKPCTITPSFLVSTKKMFEVQCDVDIYLPNGIDITAKGETYRLPDSYYAVGENGRKHSVAKYEFKRSMLTAEVTNGIGHEQRLRVGLTMDADHYRFRDIEAQDSTADLTRLEKDGGTTMGMGGMMAIDSRDNVVSPRCGWYARLMCTAYVPGLSNGRQFGVLTIDARRYWALPHKSALAAQVYAAHSWGDIPFVKMPTFGGTRLGRAIGHNLKYLDKEAWLMQCEWRVPLFWRIGATTFVAAGNTMSTPRKATNDMHAMAGCGLRFAVFPGKGLNLRLDCGVGTHGDHAIYFNIREAF